MDVRNFTRFEPLVFPSRDVQRRELLVAVARGTFEIRPDAALRPLPREEQEPPAVADTFSGVPGRSSLLAEGDLAPFKPRSDIHVHAIAHAPGRRKAPSFLAGVRVGALRKVIRVTGPRSWARTISGMRLGAPEPVVEVPIRYEDAFGGTFVGRDGKCVVFEENPIGKGYFPEGASPAAGELGPCIESPDDPVESAGRAHRPEGLGPVFRAWMPRRQLAGTFDERWRTEDWPELPRDFDAAYHNSAHPDLVYPGYLRGDEEVELSNLDPAGLLRFRLPGIRVGLILRYAEGFVACASGKLDTLRVDAIRGRAHLTWRSTFVRRPGLMGIDVRAAAPPGGEE